MLYRLGLIAIVGALALAVTWRGIPILRHDWSWPTNRHEVLGDFYYAYSGWFDFGYGTPNPYPNAFVLAPLESFFGLTVGPLLSLATIVALIASVIVFAVAGIGQAVHSSRVMGLCAAALACFNPWTYNELVAGHIGMLAAYSALFLLARCIVSADLSDRSLIVVLALAASQIQYFLPIGMVVVVMGVRFRRLWPVCVAALLIMPVAIGILGNLHWLAAIPDLGEWYKASSVPILGAVRMSGYFADYARDFNSALTVVAEYGIAVLGIIGLAFGRMSVRIKLLFTLQSLIALVICGGANVPFVGWWLYHNAPWLVGTYREMYDIVPFVFISFIVGALAISRSRFISLAWAASAFTIILTWFALPVATWWMTSTAIPKLHPSVAMGYRYAVLPAFQPVSFRGAGAGADPDVSASLGVGPPLNEYIPDYPVGAALSLFSIYGDSSALASLGVQKIYIRSGFQTVPSSQFWDHRKEAWSSKIVKVTNAVPLFSRGFIDYPRTVDHALYQFSAGRSVISPYRGWAPLDFASIQLPKFAFPLGGVLTVSEKPLSVGSARFIFGKVKGRLTGLPTAGILAYDTRGFRWIRVPAGVHSVRCAGTCALVGASDRPSNAFDIMAPLRNYSSCQFIKYMPWLYNVNCMRSGANAMEFNARYNESWIALSNGRMLDHVRTAPLSNVWRITSSERRMWVVNWIAALQAIFALTAAVCVYGGIITPLFARSPRRFGTTK